MAAPLKLALVLAALVALGNLAVGQPGNALVAALRVLALMSAAAAVSLTTPMDAILGLIERGLAPFGPRGRRAAAWLGLAVGLVLRLVPQIFAEIGLIREAQAARGLRVSPLHLVVPLVIRNLVRADDIAEALEARGFPPDGVSPDGGTADRVPADGRGKGTDHDQS
ncbi:energy-coupling factor transporter transmembrane component T family protein [Methylobrevis pamukkalensis]|uniref:Energy-coupling factor transporter transmembrane protein BioN n=1 Tax=Methylobrevis pamukkalensis TaxID=1439726 RepID=A0A1E3H2D8_9HYPH|nr:energy-coupling factor transporter transmembrane protein EcfT [Methylobrevis pamukkalensis]ODN69701.1 Energy-coupling factor transporter transmembrane protein BioN [Methylobrevis pamukkalensis]